MPEQANPDLKDVIREARDLCRHLEEKGWEEIQRIVAEAITGYRGRPLLLVLRVCAHDRGWEVKGEEVADEYSVGPTLLRHLLHKEGHPTCRRCGSSESLYYVGYIYLGPPAPPRNTPSKLVVRTAFGRNLEGTAQGGRIVWREFRETRGVEESDGLYARREIFPPVGSLREYLGELERGKREEDKLKENPMFG
jgi:hypothetical protein